MNKLLLFVFFILLILALGEIGFYFFYQPKNQLSSFPATDNSSFSSSEESLQKGPNHALNYQSLYQLSRMRKGLLVSSQLHNQYQGIMKEVNTQGGVLSPNYKYVVMIKLLSNNSDQSTNFTFRQDELQKTKVFLKTGDKQVPINLSDLKVGDTLMIDEVLDLTKSPEESTIMYTITKISPS